jgi:hypothetical protein
VLTLRHREGLEKRDTDQLSRVLALTTLVLVWPLFIGTVIWRALRQRG